MLLALYRIGATLVLVAPMLLAIRTTSPQWLARDRASLRSVFDALQLQRDRQSCRHIHHISAIGCLVELLSDIPPSRLIPCLRGQVAIEQRTHLGECGEVYDSRNDQRSQQWPRPIRMSHIGPT